MPDLLGGSCSGTPPECIDCNKVVRCKRKSNLDQSGAIVFVSQQVSYNYEYVNYNPRLNYKCPIGKKSLQDQGTPDDDCSLETPCSLGEGPCTERDTCQDGLRCGTKNCGNFPGNSNSDANCCYDPYRPGITSFPCILISITTQERATSFCLTSRPFLVGKWRRLCSGSTKLRLRRRSCAAARKV